MSGLPGTKGVVASASRRKPLAQMHSGLCDIKQLDAFCYAEGKRRNTRRLGWPFSHTEFEPLAPLGSGKAKRERYVYLLCRDSGRVHLLDTASWLPRPSSLTRSATSPLTLSQH